MFCCLSVLILALVYLKANSRLLHQNFRWNQFADQHDLKQVTYAELNAPYVMQKLTHFNESETREWKQYFRQDDEHHKEGGPEFLFIGGEGSMALNSFTHQKFAAQTWAERLSARVWVVEHRFYGKSRPVEDMSVQNLRFLSSREALADLAEFIRVKNVELKLKNPKWVIFGGSYAGALALWFRQKYPELSVGAVGSSAPIQLQADFFDFQRVCEDVYTSHDVKCAENIKLGFEEMRNLLETKNGRDHIDKIFELDPPFAKTPLTYQNLQHFYLRIMEILGFLVQYKGGVAPVCKIMTTSAKSPIDRLVEVRKQFPPQSSDAFDTRDDNYDSEVKRFHNTSFDSRLASDRAWIWQTCNEFGYFQTTGYNGIFGSGVPVNYHYNLCVDIYGDEYNIDWIQRGIQETVDYYGRAEDFNATNVVIPNGSIDPWSALGAYKQNNPTMFPLLINGTAHCEDVGVRDDESDELKKVHAFIFQKLQEWIGIKPVSMGDQKTVTEMEGKARRAPDFDAKICWNCGVPKNEHIRHNKQSNALLKRSESSVFGGRQMGRGFRDHVFKDAKVRVPLEKVKTHYIEQPVDHFDQSNNSTYQQLFFSNDVFYKPGGPIFLYINEEAEANAKSISSDVPLLDWAEKYHAMLFLVEHRFYGKSQPTANMSIENLRYLTSEQALADLATFIKQMNKNMSLENPKWISYGGSYGGSLSAWFREVYPDITFAAIGSSGPVEAQVDYYGYLQTVEASLKSHSNECAETLKEAFERIHSLFLTWEGRQVLNAKLNVDPPFTAEPIDDFSTYAFFDKLIEPFMEAVQYSDIYNGISDTCGNLTDSKTQDIVDRLQIIRGGEPTQYDPQDYYDRLKQDSGIRAWIWQTCNEFGWYYSSDIGRGAFGSSMPVNFFLKMCTEGFDKSLNRDKLERNVKATNQRYGGARGYKSSRVIQLYGSLDPWKAAGYFPVDGDHGEDVISIVINGTSHCSDMGRKGDQVEIGKALKTVESYLDKWLKS